MKKYILTLGFIAIASLLFAQPAYLNKKKARKPNAGDKFLQTQWWLGFKSGVNMSEAVPETRFTGFTPTNYEASMLEKEYGSFDDLAGQAGLEITFYHRGFSFSFQPNYRRQTFRYSNSYEWFSTEIPDNSIRLDYENFNKLDFIELPVLVKYDIIKQGKFRPFVQAGFFYATLVNAQKEIEISGEDQASGLFENQNLIIGADELFINSSIGWAAGAGVYYDFWNVRLVLDATYKMGLNNITNTNNRYSENQLSGIGDAMDDIMMNNISINFGCLFPMRFISNQGHNPVR